MTRRLQTLSFVACVCALAWLLAGRARAQHVDLDGAFGAEVDEDGAEASAEGEAETEAVTDSESETDSESDSESESETDSETESGSEAAEAEPEDAQSDVLVHPFVGAGLGTRAFLRPTLLGPQRLETVLFRAVDVGLGVRFWPAESFSLGVMLSYQSSVGLEIKEPTLFAIPTRLSARAERVELTLAPTFRLGDGADSVALGFPIGFGMRTFWPEAHEFRTPGYSLAGPQLRVELLVPFSDSIQLRVGPELLWAIALDHTLRDAGVDSQAIGVGGEAALALQLGSVIGLELSYRESHAFAATTKTSVAFEDVERFATVRVRGSL